MKYAVIAAGDGSRLLKEGISTPKPLIEVNGERLVDRLLRIFESQGASEVAVICNSRMPEVSAHLATLKQAASVPMRIVVKSTPSGVTDYIDDEKPLYIETDEAGWITAFLDQSDRPQYVSGGIYALTPRSLTTLNKCVERGEMRMRNFQRALLHDGFRLKAWPFSKILDIDHASDIGKAEAFVLG